MSLKIKNFELKNNNELLQNKVMQSMQKISQLEQVMI